jgi:hypothetical protein
MPLLELDTRERPILQEPIYRRQEDETDREYEFFLIYRDISWDERTLRKATAIATGVPEGEVTVPHSQIAAMSAKWQWPMRADAYDLFIQENRSERQEKIVLHMKSEIEHTCMRLVSKIAKITNIANADELLLPEMKRDMAVVQAMVPEGGAGKFMLETYKTIIGQKLQLGTTKKLPQLEWIAEA